MGKKRINFYLGSSLYDHLERLAESEETTVSELLRRYVALGVLLQEHLKDGTVLLEKEGEQMRKLTILDPLILIE